MTLPQAPCGWKFRSPPGTLPFSFEEADLLWWEELISKNWKWPLYIGAIYILTIFGGQRLMKSRPAMDLKTPLILWNLGLGLFSIMGFVRTAPGLLQTLVEPGGFYKSICKKDWFDTPTGFWTVMFILSKVVELGDTVFIVLRKRKLQLIGWFHHVATLNVAWMLSPIGEPITVWFIAVNYLVHSFMYPYFALTSIGVSIPKKVANLITTLQLSQMVIAFALNIITVYYYQTGAGCARSATSIKVFLALYGVFIILFSNLFYTVVLTSKRKQKSYGVDESNGKSK